jgi:cytochrome c-type biogenesis protein CcmH
MQRIKYYFLFTGIFILPLVCLGKTENFYFNTLQEEREFVRFLKEFRCVTCPNQTIADSMAPIALAMQEEVYRRWKKGESKSEIRQYLLIHYGEYITYNPLFKKTNWVLWLFPFMMCLLGLFGWKKVCTYR